MYVCGVGWGVDEEKSIISYQQDLAFSLMVKVFHIHVAVGAVGHRAHSVLGTEYETQGTVLSTSSI